MLKYLDVYIAIRELREWTMEVNKRMVYLIMARKRRPQTENKAKEPE